MEEAKPYVIIGNKKHLITQEPAQFTGVDGLTYTSIAQRFSKRYLVEWRPTVIRELAENE